MELEFTKSCATVRRRYAECALVKEIMVDLRAA